MLVIECLVANSMISTLVCVGQRRETAVRPPGKRCGASAMTQRLVQLMCFMMIVVDIVCLLCVRVLVDLTPIFFFPLCRM